MIRRGPVTASQGFLTGIVFMAFGAYLLFIGTGAARIAPAKDVPLWMVTMFGITLTSAGGAMVLRYRYLGAFASRPDSAGSPLVRAADLVLVLSSVGSMCAMCGWIAWGAGSRHFNTKSSVPLLGAPGEHTARIGFGIAATLLGMLWLARLAAGLRRLGRWELSCRGRELLGIVHNASCRTIISNRFEGLMRADVRSLISLSYLALVACGAGTTSTGVHGGQADTGFVVLGNPESSAGATWSYKGTLDGISYDLAGVLYKPVGPGPFPAVLLSHGSDGSAAFFSNLVAPTMVSWGLVCIAVNYTHSSGVPIGSPGNANDVGATVANVQRARMTYLLLRKLGYVDMSRVAAHGHSMGAYVDVALLGAYPSDFRVASHTGGGIRPAFIVAGPAPTVAEGLTIRTPYQMHHGDADTTVALSYDQRQDSVLTATGVEHQLFVYPGLDHLAVRTSPIMFQRIHDWYRAHGLF
jgi:dienelactone hydrolase